MRQYVPDRSEAPCRLVKLLVVFALGMLLGRQARAEITYTCGNSTNASVSMQSICMNINTRMNAVYGVFTNVNAHIFIQFGFAGAGFVGSSVFEYFILPYTSWHAALMAGATSDNDAASLGPQGSIPATEPAFFTGQGINQISLTNANARALGRTPTLGVDSTTELSCSLGTPNCYDGLITISNTDIFWYRSGTQGSAYDFFTVVEHETDEVLGTGSCLDPGSGVNTGKVVNDCISSAAAPVDFFRFSSANARTFSVGCTNLTNCGNAYFSIDNGTTMLNGFNNLPYGLDFSDWSTHCQHVQDANLCPGASFDITSNGGPEVEVLDVLGYKTTAAGALQFTPVSPCRIMDTRGASGVFGGPFIAPGNIRGVPVQSSPCGIPASARAYALNITVIPKTSNLGFLTVWPTGQSQPLVSTLNSPDGSILANAVLVPAGTGGNISVYATDATDLVIDINGYFAPPSANSLQFYPLTPCRVLDTRNAAGTFGGPFLAAGSNRAFPFSSSSCALPALARAYSVNLTVVPHGALGYLTAWPTGQAQPVVSTLNSLDGTVLANAAIIPAGGGGSASFYASNDTDLIVDVNGYFAAPGTGGLNFFAATPCRIVDTRNANGSFGGPAINGNTNRTFTVPSSICGLPGNASAYAFNMTVVPQGPLGFLTVWPAGQSQPGVSTLNAPKGLILANAAIVPAGTSGAINVFAANTTHLVIDTNGYFGQ